ncbi:MAG: hypothetical protein ACXW3D_05055 [Caulobacteraceae bacterium]
MEASNPRRGRYAVGLSLDYILRALNRYIEAFGGDLVDAILCIAITRANTQYLVRGLSPVEAMNFGLVDDDRRRPVSIKSVADSLGLPYETVRRRIGRLAENGVCTMVRGGVIIGRTVIDGPGVNQALDANLADLTRFCNELKRIGFIDVSGGAAEPRP